MKCRTMANGINHAQASPGLQARLVRPTATFATETKHAASSGPHVGATTFLKYIKYTHQWSAHCV